jgi:hypothetical protein
LVPYQAFFLLLPICKMRKARSRLKSRKSYARLWRLLRAYLLALRYGELVWNKAGFSLLRYTRQHRRLKLARKLRLLIDSLILAETHHLAAAHHPQHPHPLSQPKP